jgi:hypothetical protein
MPQGGRRSWRSGDAQWAAGLSLRYWLSCRLTIKDRRPIRQQLADLPYQPIAALDLDGLDFLELLKQGAGRLGVVSEPFEAHDELSLSGNMLFAENYTLLGLDKPCFEFRPIHLKGLAQIT